jgi:hypothetical protein
LRNRKQFSFYLGFYGENGLQRGSRIEALIAKKLGVDWLNDGAKKDAAFGIMQAASALLPPAAIVMVTAMNLFKPTARFEALPSEKQEYYASGNNRHHEGAKLGYFTIADGFWAIVQTPERVCIATQIIGGDRPEKSVFMDHDDYDGRTKMYPAKDEALRMLAELDLV